MGFISFAVSTPELARVSSIQQLKHSLLGQTMASHLLVSKEYCSYDLPSSLEIFFSIYFLYPTIKFGGLQDLGLVLLHFSTLLLDTYIDIYFSVSSYAQMTHRFITPDQMPPLSITSECPLDITKRTQSHPKPTCSKLKKIILFTLVDPVIYNIANFR